MGKLLSLLSRDDSNCCSSPRYDIFLDFENAAPTDTERDVYEEVQRVLLDSEKILEEIQCYKGAGKEIREAIADPSRISQERAWRAVRPLVDKLLRCYNHSLQLQRVSPWITTSTHLTTTHYLVYLDFYFQNSNTSFYFTYCGYQINIKITNQQTTLFCSV